MSDKVIVDGVDVSGCGFRHKDTDNQCHIALAFSEEYGECWHCEQIENCYYKQLQRLKIENEKMKQALEDVRELTKLTVEFHNFACKKNCEDYKGPKEYHLLCRLMRISEKIYEVLKDENH